MTIQRVRLVGALLASALAALAFTAGIAYERYRAGWIRLGDGERPGAELVREEVATSVLAGKRVMVALVAGQSNAANFGAVRHAAREGVLNFHRGRLYRARDPLLGADSEGGSVWTRLGDALVEKGHYDAVVFAPVAVGTTSIAHWTTTGALHGRILETARELLRTGLPPTHFLWHQGETDAVWRTGGEAYRRMFLAMLDSVRQQGVDAPVYVSVATRCKARAGDPDLQRGQRSLVDPTRGIFAGPDTDTLGLCLRYDGCHFTEEGLARFADLWLAALTAPQ